MIYKVCGIIIDLFYFVEFQLPRDDSFFREHSKRYKILKREKGAGLGPHKM